MDGNRGRGWKLVAGLIAAGAITASFLAGQTPASRPDGNLGDLTIEQLMNEPVTSVAKKATDLFQSPAAISVVTDDDISRLDATTIPEALRYVPGVDVARVNGSTWAVAVRGNNSEFSNDTLVMIDGRTIYEVSSGGVYWVTQEIPMQDIDRIEVVRGAGSTLWGANAFNGVINIITKSADQTQGLRLTTNEGTLDNPTVILRYGGKAGDSIYYRAYADFSNQNGLVDTSGTGASDFFHGWRTGFRLDASPSTQDTLTLQGDGYDVDVGQSLLVPQPRLGRDTVNNVVNANRGENLLGKWVRRTSDSEEWSVQVFYNHFHNVVADTQEVSDTGDFEFQDHFAWGSRQDIVAGLGYRYIRSDLPPTVISTWSPEVDVTHLYTAFVQDQAKLIPDRLSLIAGTKFEHNDKTSSELEPGVRGLWTPTSAQTFWVGATRAIRTPAVSDTDVQITTVSFLTAPGGPPAEVMLNGNPDIHRSEKVDAYEAGYRVQPTPELSLDVALFYNVYRDLIYFGPVQTQLIFDPGPDLHLISTSTSGGTGDSYGGEASVQWRVMGGWRLAADYSLLRSTYYPENSKTGNSPRHEIHLRTYIDLPHGFEVNGAAEYVSSVVDSLTAVPQFVPSYVRFDLGVVWRPSPALELGVWGQNLGQRKHLEFANDLTPVLFAVPRQIAARVTWRR